MDLKKALKSHRFLRWALDPVRYARFCLHRVQFALTEKERLLQFRDRHVGERCFIVGNGPSIKKQDMTRLKDEPTFVTNHFPLHSQFAEIAPEFYCVSDPRFFLAGPNEDWLRSMRDGPRQLAMFLPFASKKHVQRTDFLTDYRVFYLNYRGRRIFETGTMSADPLKWVDTGDTVIIDFCLPLAGFMGFREIFLLGCDTDYGLDNAEDYSQAYFYESGRTSTPRQDPDYHRRLWYDRVTKSYRVAKALFEQKGVRIYNATLGGKLEVFPRVDFERVLRSHPLPQTVSATRDA